MIELKKQQWLDFEAWDVRLCTYLRQWHRIETGNGGLSVIDVDALCEEEIKVVNNNALALSPRQLQQARLDVYGCFHTLYHEIESGCMAKPLKEILLRRLSSFCSDIEDLVSRPEERSRHERYERRMHMPYEKISDEILQLQAARVLDYMKLWVAETGIDFDLGSDDTEIMERVLTRDFKTMFRDHFERLKVEQDPDAPQKLREGDLQQVRDCIERTVQGIRAYWKKSGFWSGPDFDVNIDFRYSFSEEPLTDQKEAFVSWLYGKGNQFDYVFNLDLPKSDNEDRKPFYMIRARLDYEVTHEIFHARHLTNLWSQLRPENQKVRNDESYDIPLNFGLTTVRSSEIIPGEFGADGLAGILPMVVYEQCGGTAGPDSRRCLENLIFGQYKWLLLMINNRIIRTGQRDGLEAANAEKMNIYFQGRSDRNVNKSILPRALDWQGTSFDPYYTPVYGQGISWIIKIIQQSGREACEHILSDVSWRYMDGPALMEFLKNRGCDMGVSVKVLPPPPHWNSFVGKMQFPVSGDHEAL